MLKKNSSNLEKNINIKNLHTAVQTGDVMSDKIFKANIVTLPHQSKCAKSISSHFLPSIATERQIFPGLEPRTAVNMKVRMDNDVVQTSDPEEEEEIQRVNKCKV